jgi:uncharacterized membrane protein YqjE
MKLQEVLKWLFVITGVIAGISFLSIMVFFTWAIWDNEVFYKKMALTSFFAFIVSMASCWVLANVLDDEV